jgi:putative DNA primase/helicase
VRFDKVFRGTKDEIKDLAKQFIPEYPGILNWALEGLKEIRTNDGLHEPEVVRQAVKDYMTEENIVARWLRDCCTKIHHGGMTPKQAFASFKQWADERDEYYQGERWFNVRMTQLGEKSTVSNSKRFYPGLVLQEEIQSQPSVREVHENAIF